MEKSIEKEGCNEKESRGGGLGMTSAIGIESAGGKGRR